jgi:hypothetical protein
MSSASDVKSSHFDPGDLIIESILDCPAFRALAGRVTGRHAVQVDSQDGNEFRAAFRAGERDLAVLFFHSPILAPCAAFCAAEPSDDCVIRHVGEAGMPPPFLDRPGSVPELAWPYCYREIPRMQGGGGNKKGAAV